MDLLFRSRGTRSSNSNRTLSVDLEGWSNIPPTALVEVEGLQFRPCLDQPIKFVVVQGNRIIDIDVKLVKI